MRIDSFDSGRKVCYNHFVYMYYLQEEYHDSPLVAIYQAMENRNGGRTGRAGGATGIYRN